MQNYLQNSTGGKPYSSTLTNSYSSSSTSTSSAPVRKVSSTTTPAAAAAPASPKPSNKNSSNKKGGGPPSTASNSQQPPRRKSSLLGFNFANFSISGNNNNKDPKETPIITTTTTGSSSSPAPSRKSSGITAPVTATLNGLLRKTSTSIARSGSGTDNNLSNSTTMAARMSTSSQASARSINARRKPEDVVHQGWLMKRGEHIKNWRARYFILFKDGALLGFKNVVTDYKDPLNDFTVKDVQSHRYFKV
uniref:PH domain-containing protein n=1 Tax=Panagrolaimus sp. PS1159 TaxID=55785 RepID=A0AC35GLE3_9BILA